MWIAAQKTFVRGVLSSYCTFIFLIREFDEQTIFFSQCVTKSLNVNNKYKSKQIAETRVSSTLD